MITGELENSLNNLLQRDVSFIIRDRATREGKLILYYIKDFYITFVLITSKQQKRNYEIPVPYKIRQKDGSTYFDYRVKHIYRNNNKIKDLIDDLHDDIGKNSRLYDGVMTIRANPSLK